jgi:hypothetical protein
MQTQLTTARAIWVSKWPKLTLLRRVGRIGLGLSVLVILAILSWFILSPWLLPRLLPFAEFVIQHRSIIRILTAVLALLCALFFFWPREVANLVGRWNKYVGLAFATFFIQYFLRYLDFKWRGHIGAPVVHYGVDFVVYLCSGLNNLLFLAAARILLNKNVRIRKPLSSGKKSSRTIRLKETLARGVAEFNGALPKWAWFAALFSLVALLDAKPGFFWARFPDAVFSMYCLSWFGYATAINFNVRRRVLLAALALIVSLSYGLAQLAYATNSVVAHTVPPNIVTRFPLTWIQREIGKPLNNLVLKSNSATGRTVAPSEFLENAIYVVLLPMKWALFCRLFSFIYCSSSRQMTSEEH